MYSYLVLSLLTLLIAFLVWGKVERQWVGLAIALTLLLTGAISLDEVVTYVDWDVLGLILGISIYTMFLERSGFTALVANRIVEKFRYSLSKLMFFLPLVAGFISIFMENVSVVILMYPIVLNVYKTIGLDPTITTILVALSANIAGSATMVGDPPAIITAGAFGLSFTDFIVYRGLPSMFFLTIISMITAIATTYELYARKVDVGVVKDVSNNISVQSVDRVFVIEALTFLCIKIILLSIRNVLHIPLSLTAAIAVGGITLARAFHRDRNTIAFAFKHGFEWKLLVFLLSVFMLSGAFEKHGIAKAFAERVIVLTGGNLVAITSVLVWLCVAMSSVIDNVPITVTMIPIVRDIAASLRIDPVILMWAALIGITLGGNFTYIGASANVAAVRLLEKSGYNVSFSKFIKVSLIYNTVSVVVAWILYTLIYLAI